MANSSSMAHLAEEHGARRLEPRHGGAVVWRLEAAQDLRAGGGLDALLAEEVLEGERDAVERRERGLRVQTGVGGAGLCQGTCGVDAQEGVNLGVDALDAIERSR